MPPRKYLSRTRFAQINPFELFMPFQKLGIKKFNFEENITFICFNCVT